ncbi:MAG: type III-A CRISPR-associated RAMP protein Csm3 [Methermicoccaceae archaeon]
MDETTLKGKLIIRGRLVADTGLHIGVGRGGIEIGGVDNPVIKNAYGVPYIPGSSLKGKMRSLLEKHLGKAELSEMVMIKKNPPIRIHMCNEPDCEVCTIFGRNNAKMERADENGNIEIKKTTPTRLYVRDCPLIEESIPKTIRKHLDMEWTEVKSENSIDRITSAANPRQSERIPPGAEFDVELIYNVFTKEDVDRLRNVLVSMSLLENDFLGGQGSRGYGKVHFTALKLVWNSQQDYEEGSIDIETKKPLVAAKKVADALQELNTVKSAINSSF